MKKLFISLIACFAAFSFAQDINSEIPQVEMEGLNAQMETLVNAMNTSDGEMLSSLIGTNATEAVKGVSARLKGNKIEYIVGNPTYEVFDENHIKSTWKVSSESTGTNGNVSITGFSHNATFEKQGQTWKIIDGSFDPTSMGSIGWIFGLVFGILGLIFIPLGILWILMLIHAAKHDIHNKTTWVILMCLLGFPVSIIYFFTERKRFNTSVTLNLSAPTSVV